MKKNEGDLFQQASSHLKEGGSIDSALKAFEAISDPVNKSALLRNVAMEAMERGSGEDALKVAELEKDPDKKERTLGAIALAAGRKGDAESAVSFLNKLSAGDMQKRMVSVMDALKQTSPKDAERLRIEGGVAVLEDVPSETAAAGETESDDVFQPEGSAVKAEEAPVAAVEEITEVTDDMIIKEPDVSAASEGATEPAAEVQDDESVVEEGNVVSLDDFREQKVRDAASEKDAQIESQADAIAETQEQIKKSDAEVWTQANEQLKVGGSIDTALVAYESLSGKVEKSALLRNIVAETTKRGNVDRALKLTERETDLDQRSRDIAMISIQSSRDGHLDTALRILDKVTYKDRKDNALRQIAPELAKKDMAAALKLAEQISNEKLRKEVIGNLKSA